MTSDLVLLAEFNDRHEAEMAAGYLRNRGVPPLLRIDDASGMELGMAFSNPARRYVRSQDDEKARAILADAGVETTGERA